MSSFLFFRASESNMQSIANAVEDLYMSNSRASVNESLFMLITEAVVSTVLTPERLVAEMAMLVAVLHGNVGSEVGTGSSWQNISSKVLNINEWTPLCNTVKLLMKDVSEFDPKVFCSSSVLPYFHRDQKDC